MDGGSLFINFILLSGYYFVVDNLIFGVFGKKREEKERMVVVSSILL